MKSSTKATANAPAKQRDHRRLDSTGTNRFERIQATDRSGAQGGLGRTRLLNRAVATLVGVESVDDSGSAKPYQSPERRPKNAGQLGRIHTEKLLESSGLREGVEFETEKSLPRKAVNGSVPMW